MTLCDTPDRSGVTGSVESTTYSTIIVNGAETKLNINGGIIRQTTGIAVNVMDGAAVTISGIATLEGQICMMAGTNVSITLDGGTVTASKMGIQATPEDTSTTAVTVHSGTITSDNISIYAKDLTLDAVDGKTATLTGKLSLTQNATITEGTSVLAGDKQVTELKQFTGAITVKKSSAS